MYETSTARYKRVVLEYAAGLGSDAKAYREFGVKRSTFYRWKKVFAEQGEAGLLRRRPVARSHPRRLPPAVVEQVLHLRQTYHLGPERIMWYLARYHGVETSCSTIYRALVRHGLRRLPKHVGRRAIHTRRYAKQVPGHHIQVDVRFLG